MQLSIVNDKLVNRSVLWMFEVVEASVSSNEIIPSLSTLSRLPRFPGEMCRIVPSEACEAVGTCAALY